jgi:autotransporter family porin
LYARVTGNFTGTTDEIIQWAACKWGIDEDIVRAQVAKESYWTQDAAGDYGSDPKSCVPGQTIGENRDQPGQCPQSIGLMQVRYPYWSWAFPGATASSAYNLDAALAARRNCFDGNETWLNTVEGGKDYAAGDIWGCIGLWFSGRWYDQPAKDYIAAVQAYLSSRVWESSSFINYR